MRRRNPSAGSAAGPSIVRATYKKPETPPRSSETKGKDVFQEIDKHLLIVSDAVAALVEGETYPKARLARLAIPLPNEVTIPNRNERWASAPRGFDLQFFVVTSALVAALGLGSFGGWGLHQYMGRSDELSGRAAVSALVERIMAVEVPTPPLPAPTAMTFFTPGTGCRVPSAPTASRTRALICTSTAGDAGNLHHGRARLIAHLILHRTRRRRQLDRERDAAAVDLQILDEAEADDVAVQIGIADDLAARRARRVCSTGMV